VLSFTPEGPLLCVRPYTSTKDYWQVYFDTNRAIIETFREAGYPTPETPVVRRVATDLHITEIPPPQPLRGSQAA
jgi:small conductance mechanosensitive channel